MVKQFGLLGSGELQAVLRDFKLCRGARAPWSVGTGLQVKGVRGRGSASQELG